MRKILKAVFFIAIIVSGVYSTVVSAQDPINQSQDDFDVVTIPVMRSVQISGMDYQGGGLEAMGLRLDTVDAMTPCEIVEQTTDWLHIRLHAGDAVRLWSLEGIPLSSDSASCHCIASVSGENLKQAGLAFIDSKQMDFLSVNLSYTMDIPKQKEEFSFEYQTKAKNVFLLMQFVGPETGVSDLFLERIRVASGYREIQMALGNTLLSAAVNFGEDPNKIITTNSPPSTLGGYIKTATDTNRTPYPHTFHQALLLGAKTDMDILQVQIPFGVFTVQMNERVPKRIYAEAYIKRKSGEKGIFSLGLFRGDTASGGYTDIPIASIPADQWLRVESSVLFSNVLGQIPLFILQIREGQAEVLVDDVALRGWHDSVHFWNSKLLQ